MYHCTSVSFFIVALLLCHEPIDTMCSVSERDSVAVCPEDLVTPTVQNS